VKILKRYTHPMHDWAEAWQYVEGQKVSVVGCSNEAIGYTKNRWENSLQTTQGIRRQALE
jgi:hypothetical protein